MEQRYKKTERRPGISEFAAAQLLAVVYVDIHGRNVGFDYATILERIKTKFPQSSTTRKEVQKIGYALNANGVRLPVRRRSRKIMARDYVRVLLVEGKSYEAIKRSARRRFPGVPLPASFDMVRAHLVRAKLLPPKQRGKK